MVAEIFNGISALKTITDIAKTIKDMDSATVRNAAVIQLQEHILTAHEAQSALIARVRELEEKVRNFENWESQKDRYELHDEGNGALCYRLKDGVEPPELPHKICANCYEHGRKSFINRQEWKPYAEVLVCNGCGAVTYVSGYPREEHAKLRPPHRAA